MSAFGEAAVRNCVCMRCLYGCARQMYLVSSFVVRQQCGVSSWHVTANRLCVFGRRDLLTAVGNCKFMAS